MPVRIWTAVLTSVSLGSAESFIILFLLLSTQQAQPGWVRLISQVINDVHFLFVKQSSSARRWGEITSFLDTNSSSSCFLLTEICPRYRLHASSKITSPQGMPSCLRSNVWCFFFFREMQKHASESTHSVCAHISDDFPSWTASSSLGGRALCHRANTFIASVQGTCPELPQWKHFQKPANGFATCLCKNELFSVYVNWRKQFAKQYIQIEPTHFF